MNPTKAAAIIALIVTLCAASYFVYQLAFVKPKYESDVHDYQKCTSEREETLRHWKWVQDMIENLKTQQRYKEAAEFEKKHAGEKPLFFGECSDYVALQPPSYILPSAATAVIGLIASLALFGAAKPKS